VLEVVLCVLFAQASLLITGGMAHIGVLVPSMVVGGVWASLHTPYNPIAAAAGGLKRPDLATTLTGKGDIPPVQASQPTTPSETDPDIEEAGYSIEVACSECGAQVAVPVLAHMAHCAFCGSDHLVIGHDETLYVTIPERIRDEHSLCDAVLDHYRYLHYLKLYRTSVAPLEAGTTEASQSGHLVTRPEVSAAVAAAELAISKKADAYRSQLARNLKITHTQRFLAPYRHGMGTLFQAAFGRSRKDQEKQLKFAVGVVEAAVLGTDALDLPPMGKLSYLRALVPAAQCNERVMGLPLDIEASDLATAYGELDRKQLVRDLQVIRLGSRFTQEVAAVVWRPWWIAEIHGPKINETLLVDGAAASVAGTAPYLSPDALCELPAQAREPGSGLRFVPMECPTCGHEYRFDHDAVLHFCHNCHRVCGVEHDRKQEIEYLRQDVPEGNDFDLVPFWYFPLEILTADGNLLTDLMHLKDGIDGTLDQIGDDAEMRRHGIMVPAFRCVNPRLMALAFERLLMHTLRRPAILTSERFPLDTRPKPWAVSLIESTARNLFPLYLVNALSRRDLTRVNVNQVTAWLFEAKQVREAKLAYIPVPRPVTEPFRAYVGRYRSRAVRHASGESSGRAPRS
jgi:Zn finger protein HypA/HybF involved in hydrogenase expression